MIKKFNKSINDNLSKGFKIDLFLYDFINEKQLEQNIQLYRTYLNTFYKYHDQYFLTLENKINKFFYEYSMLFNLNDNKNNYELFLKKDDTEEEKFKKEKFEKLESFRKN